MELLAGFFTLLSTLLLGLMIVLCVGAILWHVLDLAGMPYRVEDIRRLRREGLAVNQARED